VLFQKAIMATPCSGSAAARSGLNGCGRRQPPDPEFHGPGRSVRRGRGARRESRTADATAGEPTELCVLRREDFLSHLEREPRVAIKIIQLLCSGPRRAERMEESMLQAAAGSARAPVVALAIRDYGSRCTFRRSSSASSSARARKCHRQLQAGGKTGILELCSAAHPGCTT